MPRPQRRPKSSRDANGSGGGSGTTSKQGPADLAHSAHLPCCDDLAVLARQVFLPSTKEGTATDGESSEQNALVPVLRQHVAQLVAGQRRQLQLSINETTASSHKRKKKKKKRRKGDITGANDVEEDDDDDNAADDVAKQSTKAASKEWNTAASSKTPPVVPVTPPSPTTPRQQQSKVNVTSSQPKSENVAPLPVFSESTPAAALTTSDELMLRFVERYSTGHPDVIDNNADTTTTIDSFQSFWQSIPADVWTEQQLVVTQERLDGICRRIACATCRQDLENYFVAHSVVPVRDFAEMVPRRRRGATTRLDDDPSVSGFVDERDMNAFDYVALEEGHGLTTTTKHHGGSGGGDDNDGVTPSLQFELVVAQGGGSVGWRLGRTDGAPLTTAEGDLVLREVLFLAGIAPDTVLGVQIMSSELAKQIVQAADEQCRSVVADFDVVDRRLDPLPDKLLGVSRRPDDANIDLKSFNIVKEVDDEVCSLLQVCFRPVLSLGRAYHSMRLADVPAENVTWAHDTICTMWKAWFGALQAMLETTITYEQKMFTMADNYGKIPIMFVSSTARQLYHDAVATKLNVLKNAVTTCRSMVKQTLALEGYYYGPHYHVPFLEKFMTLVTFVRPSRHFAKTAEDHAWEDVLYLTREWVDTVHQSTIVKILGVHQQRRDKLRRCWELLISEFGNVMSDAAINGQHSHFANADTRFKELYALNPQEKASGLHAIRSGVVPCLSEFMLYWLSLGSAVSDPRSTILPEALVKCVVGEPTEDRGSGSCYGAFQQLRAASILTVSFYEWLSDRYKEVQARQAADELLTAIEDVAEAPLATKSKKAKKKKDKGAPMGSNVAEADGHGSKKDFAGGENGGADNSGSVSAILGAIPDSVSDMSNRGKNETNAKNAQSALKGSGYRTSPVIGAFSDSTDRNATVEHDSAMNGSKAMLTNPGTVTKAISAIKRRGSGTCPVKPSRADENALAPQGLAAYGKPRSSKKAAKNEGAKFSSLILAEESPKPPLNSVVGLYDKESFVPAEQFLANRFFLVVNDTCKDNVVFL